MAGSLPVRQGRRPRPPPAPGPPPSSGESILTAESFLVSTYIYTDTRAENPGTDSSRMGSQAVSRRIASGRQRGAKRKADWQNCYATRLLSVCYAFAICYPIHSWFSTLEIETGAQIIDTGILWKETGTHYTDCEWKPGHIKWILNDRTHSNYALCTGCTLSIVFFLKMLWFFLTL